MKLLTLVVISGFCIGCVTAKHAAIGGFFGISAVEYVAQSKKSGENNRQSADTIEKEKSFSFICGAGSGMNVGLIVALFFVNPIVGIGYMSIGSIYGMGRLKE